MNEYELCPNTFGCYSKTLNCEFILGIKKFDKVKDEIFLSALLYSIMCVAMLVGVAKCIPTSVNHS